MSLDFTLSSRIYILCPARRIDLSRDTSINLQNTAEYSHNALRGTKGVLTPVGIGVLPRIKKPPFLATLLPRLFVPCFTVIKQLGMSATFVDDEN